MIYASIDSNLLNPSSWTMTNNLAFDPDWVPKEWKASKPGYLEGNAVFGPDSEIYNILRVNSEP